MNEIIKFFLISICIFFIIGCKTNFPKDLKNYDLSDILQAKIYCQQKEVKRDGEIIINLEIFNKSRWVVFFDKRIGMHTKILVIRFSDGTILRPNIGCQMILADKEDFISLSPGEIIKEKLTFLPRHYCYYFKEDYNLKDKHKMRIKTELKPGKHLIFAIIGFFETGEQFGLNALVGAFISNSLTIYIPE